MSHPQKTPQGCQEKEGLEAQARLRNCWKIGSQWPQARVLAERALQTGINRDFALGGVAGGGGDTPFMLRIVTDTNQAFEKAIF